MNRNPQKKEEDQDVNMKKGFLKKIWYSIYKIEKYGELSAEGLWRAIKYLIILVIILAIVSSGVTIYRTSLEVKNIAKYIDENIQELEYKDEVLIVNSQEPIIDNNLDFGKIIIDTTVEDEDQINKYIKEIQNEENAVIILKDKLVLKEVGIPETTSYNYKELFQEIGITEFNKQDLIEYITGSDIMPIYLNLFLVLFIYSFIIHIINTLLNVFIISIIAYLATIILKLKIRYVAVFNMTIYAITLPTILDVIYILVNAFISYTINYFDVMYSLVSSIYIMSAIFMLKSDLNKKQGEIQRIVEIEKEVKEEIEDNRQEQKKQKDKDKNKETGKEEKEEKEEEKEKPENGESPEGSNA